MVYKIRNKSIFWTRAGWKNNWHPKNFNSPRPCNGEMTVALRCRYDHHSFLRMHHQYRQISRAAKQYLMGDSKWEQRFNIALRNLYLIPILSECLTDQIKHGGERRFADQIDRHYELISHNQHPYQLFMYEQRNRDLQDSQEQLDTINAGEQTVEEKIKDYIGQKIKEAEDSLPAGQSLTTDQKIDIVLEVVALAKEQQRQSVSARNAQGEFNDHQEQRRPFISTD